jgi:hypothetical protein
MGTPEDNYAFQGNLLVNQRGYEAILPTWKVRATWLIFPEKGPEIPMTPQLLAIGDDGSFTYSVAKVSLGTPALCGIHLELLDAEGKLVEVALTINDRSYDNNKARMTAFDQQLMVLRAKVLPLPTETREGTVPTKQNPVVAAEAPPVEPTKENPVVAAEAPPIMVITKSRTMKGRAIDKAGDPVKNTSFIVYGGRSTEGHKDLLFRPIAAGKTDGTGNFTIAVPAETYQAAGATLAIKPNQQLDIMLQGGNLPDFALLVLDETQAVLVPDKKDCACEDKPGRLPEMEDLLNPDSKYQQDIGGSCVNFTTPNRALEEYSFLSVVRNTDPQIMAAPGYLANLAMRIGKLQKAYDAIKVQAAPTGKTDLIAEIKALKAKNDSSMASLIALLNRAFLDGSFPVDQAYLDGYCTAIKFRYRFQDTKDPFAAHNLALLQIPVILDEAAAVASSDIPFSKNVSGAFALLKAVNDSTRLSAESTINAMCQNGGLPNDPTRFLTLYNACTASLRFASPPNTDPFAAQTLFLQKLREQGVIPYPFTNPAGTGNTSLQDKEWMKMELDKLKAEQVAAAHLDGLEDLTRAVISRTNQVQWDSPLPLVQPASIAHGHILQFRQVWRADGYSMGDLLYSLPLAPGQKKQLVIHDWERRESASRSEGTSYEESMSNSLSQDRDINEIVNSTMNEQSEGHSKSKMKGVSIGAGFGVQAAADVPVQPNVNVSAKVGYSGGFSAGKSSSESSAEQKSSRDVSANSMQNIREKTMQNASALRSQRSTVVTSMSQSESTTIRSESVANYNHCHAITIEYFEVLRHLAVHTELADVQECLFIPLTLSFFDDAKVARWSDLLRYALRAPRSKYSRLVRGFDALRRYYEVNALGKAEEDVYYHVPKGRYCDEKITEISGTLSLRVHFACPKKVLKSLDQATTDGIVALSNGYAGLMGITGGKSGFFLDMLIEQHADQNVWKTQLGFIKEIEDIRHKVNRISDDRREEVFQDLMSKANAVGQFANFIKIRMASQGLHTLDAHVSLTRSSDAKRARLNGEVPAYEFSFRTASHRLSAERDEIQQFGMAVGLTNFPDGTVLRLDRISANYQSPYLSTQLCSASLAEDLMAGDVMVETPMQDFERVSPRQEDLQLRNELLDHLNTNMEHYHKALWVQMDADRRLMLLDGFQIKVPARENPAYVRGGTEPEFLYPESFRSVASVVENRLVGIAGNSLIMPVAKGFNLNPVFRFANDDIEVDGKKVSRLMAYYMPEKGFKDTPFRVSIPTKGVFAEAVMGACNSCEKIDDSRFWKWDEHLIPDSPTAIDPVSADSRRADPGDLRATALGDALLKQQEGKALPDPTGLANALALLGKSDVFKDITGLEGTQKNAMEAYKLNTEAAQHYAEIAADLAKSAEVSKNGDGVAESIKRNVKDPKKAEELVQKYYENMVGGKAGAQAGGKTGGTKGKSGNGEQPTTMQLALGDSAEVGDLLDNVNKMPGGSSVSFDKDGGFSVTRGSGPPGAPFADTDPPTFLDRLLEGVKKLDGKAKFGTLKKAPATGSKQSYWQQFTEQRTNANGILIKYDWLRLRADVSPAEALDDLFDNASLWQFDCAMYVQLLHLYGLRLALGDAFNALIWSRLTTQNPNETEETLGQLEIHATYCNAIPIATVFERTRRAPESPDDQTEVYEDDWTRTDIGSAPPQPSTVSPGRRQTPEEFWNTLIERAPIGSFVTFRFTDMPDHDAKGKVMELKNVNAVKLGRDSYASILPGSDIFNYARLVALGEGYNQLEVVRIEYIDSPRVIETWPR